MTKRLILILTFIMLVFLSPVLAAESKKENNNKENAEKTELTVDEIVDKTNYVSYYQGYDGRSNVKMDIVDNQGRTRKRQFTILRWDEPDPDLSKKELPKDTDYCGEQKIYAYFHRPADVYETVFMVWKHLQKDDDRWLYLPALDLVKRISANDKRTSFVGSHFYYEDVSGRNVNDDIHELVDTTENYYVLKNTPKDKELVEFSYYKMWIHKDSFVVVKTDYFDEQGNKYRTYEALKVENIQGYPTVTKSKMSDMKSGGHTLMEYSGVEYNIGIPEDIFTERYLRRAPRKYLR